MSKLQKNKNKNWLVAVLALLIFLALGFGPARVELSAQKKKTDKKISALYDKIKKRQYHLAVRPSEKRRLDGLRL